MKVSFEEDNQLPAGEISVTIHAQKLSPQVVQLLEKLQEDSNSSDVLPINTEDRVVMVATNLIIAIEVFGTELVIHTADQTYHERGVLKEVVKRLNSSNFIRIARGIVINLDYLESLESGFSGNMTARMHNNLKMSVSRKYLPDLKNRLGM